jgi:diguanylate cyclase (GGDEF)-like protein/PAS domain S-box-containing protein
MSQNITSNQDLSLELAKYALGSANDGITIADILMPDQPLIYVNETFCKLTGYNKEDIMGKNCRYLQKDLTNQAGVAEIREAIKARKSCRVTIKNFKKNGTLFWNELNLSPIIIDGNVRYYVGIQKDVTELVMQHEKIIYLSEHDDLTDLYNYRGFFRSVEDLIFEAKNKNMYFGIGVADIDFFKKINDEHGHMFANSILTLIADQFKLIFGKSVIISRFGGDEFCFAFVGESTLEKTFDDKFKFAVNGLNQELKSQMTLSLSSGCSSVLANKDESIDVGQLIKKADMKMYDAKSYVHQAAFLHPVK